MRALAGGNGDGVHDAALPRIMTVPSTASLASSRPELRGYAAAVHDEDAVAERKYLRQLRGDEQDGAPLSRSATSSLWMNSMAPTSTPRVGCSAISTGAWCASSRAITTFCRLPPESWPTASRSLRIRMSNVLMSRRAQVRMASRLRKPRGAIGAR